MKIWDEVKQLTARRNVGELAMAIIALFFGAGSAAAADTQLSPEMKEAKEKAAVEAQDGWTNKLSFGFTASASTSRNVVGSPDGTAMLIGFQSDGSAELRRERYRWVNEGRYVFTLTRSPIVPLFLKSADTLNLKSTYFYALKRVPWLGPFARVNLSVPLLPGDLVVADDGIMTQVDLEEAESLPKLTRKRLTGAFEPLLMKQVVGFFAQPIDRPPRLKVGAQFGVGAEELLANGGVVMNDNKDTAIIELKRLENYTSLGAELSVSATGAVNESVLWTLETTLFQPVYTSADTTLTGTDLLTIDASGKVSMKLVKWASLDLVASARKYPLILDAWQVQTGALLAITFNVL